LLVPEDENLIFRQLFEGLSNTIFVFWFEDGIGYLPEMISSEIGIILPVDSLDAHFL
jgi:hypothetical protein